MRKRLQTRINERDVRLERVPLDGRDVESLTIKDIWDYMQERIGDGKWWSVGRGIGAGQLKRLWDGVRYRLWRAGYTSEMVLIRRLGIDGICFRWSWEAQNHPDIEELKKKRRLDKNAQERAMRMRHKAWVKKRAPRRKKKSDTFESRAARDTRTELEKHNGEIDELKAFLANH